MSRQAEHPDWNELAALADRGSTGAPVALLEHVATCAECRAAWAAAVEARHLHLDAGRARRTGLAGAMARTPVRVAGGIAVAALLVFILLPRHAAGPGDDMATAVVLRQLGELSRVDLVYPRVDRFSPDAPAGYRSGGSAGAAVDLSRWTNRLADDPADTTAAFWLAAAELGQGRLDVADDVLRRALAANPAAGELRHLAAITAFRRNDLAAAARHLDQLLAANPGDQLAIFNRVFIGIEAGDSARACAALERIAGQGSGSALGQRARQLAQDAGCGWTLGGS